MDIWQDVRYDVGTAQVAAAELRAAADALDRTSGRRSDLATEARGSWRGRRGDRFHRAVATLLADSVALAGALRQAAATIEDDLARAQAEQRYRVRARAAWWEDRRRREELAARVAVQP